MSVVKIMTVPIENLSEYMGTPIENIGSIGGEPVEIGGDTAVFVYGRDDSDFGVQMESMNILTGGSALFANTLSCHYGGAAGSNGSNARAIVAGGFIGTSNRGYTAEYFDIRSAATAETFGNITEGVDGIGAGTNGTNDRMVCAGGSTGSGTASLIQYFTMSTLSDSVTLADLSLNRSNSATGNNRTNERAVFCGGWRSTFVISNVIDSFMMNTSSNATSWGELDSNNWGPFGVDDAENDIMLCCGGATNYLSSTLTDRIETITISTSGSATTYGNIITQSSRGSGSTSNRTGETGVMVGGTLGTVSDCLSRIDQITINTQSSATNFGDSIYTRSAECEGVNDN